MLIGWLLGLLAGAAVSVGLTVAFSLDAGSAFLVGCGCGFVGTWLGMEWAS